MLDHNQLDEVSSVNFEAATLRISNKEDSEKTREGSNTEEIKKDSSVLSVPYKNIDVHTFFSDRDEVVERAIKEISLWDTEKERVVLLTKNALYTIKYDFISLKLLEFNRVPMIEVDTITYGELEYPKTSIAPRLNGLAEGVSSVIHCAVRQQWSSLASSSEIKFEPRKRNTFGVKIMWNKGKPLSLDKKWNPFAKRIPWVTYTSHPLYWHKSSTSEEQKRFDVDDFHDALMTHFNMQCEFTKSQIIIENYLGLGAILHNRNSLGFFRVRGKVSF
ncbi:Similar to TPRG1L: Tumor protein p63-regulated gene 1-like protein (Bos taurus) [Cotesia congregata]|uniref:Similar to TPRG1L: Tumor protein p63-regulated gene 1-like protein (Bos taurus) n=1 Tax=Cotesia congregata TaxID=51543 RepID=A0A8J2H368_COTCN|nr:Similar to TPRG1L: Tumor protein p63-regulated gene 1-like protein (Bos taurus) [Cotesia congregata]